MVIGERDGFGKCVNTLLEQKVAETKSREVAQCFENFSELKVAGTKVAELKVAGT